METRPYQRGSDNRRSINATQGRNSFALTGGNCSTKRANNHVAEGGQRKSRADLSIVDRFWSKVQRESAQECWPWRGARTRHGYGMLALGQRGANPVYAHRLSWELASGPIDGKRHVLHACDRPWCVNPAHLFLGSHLDNMRDAATKGRLSVPRPRRQKVSDEQLEQIRALARAGVRQADLARNFGVSETFISLFLKGKRRQYGAAALRKVG